MSTDYNLQPYGNNGDTTGGRNLTWMRNQVLPSMKKHFDGVNDVLDIGCGNGRFNKLIKDDFNSIHCVDPMDDINELFEYENVTFEKKHLDELSGSYDGIFMIGSMLSIGRTYTNALSLIHGLLNKGGKVYIMEDKKHGSDYTGEYFTNEGDYISPDNTTRINVLSKI